MEVMKYLLIIITASTLLISGCIDLDDSSNSVSNQFDGTWRSQCEISFNYAGSFDNTLEISSTTLIATITAYENEDCIGNDNVNATDPLQLEFQIKYGKKVTTASGVVATELDLKAPDENAEDFEPFLDLIYRDGNQLYFGNVKAGGKRATDINFDQYFTLQ